MQHNRTVSFYTLGCKLNFSETSTLGRTFESAGYARVDFDSGADVCVINTCSVTEQADKKCRNLVKRALRVNPNAFVAVIGCYAQLKPQEIAAIPGVDIVLGANDKFDVLSFIEEKKKATAEIRNTEIREAKSFHPAFSFGDRTRSFLKVQDGCDYFCAFCTIPLARGFSRSATIATTVDQARKAADTGVKEIVLTGVNIGDFGKQNSENFLQLVHALEGVEGIERFRISSIEPNLLTDDIIRFVAGSEKFVPHFHIPLQSGSDKILKLMRRRYVSHLYADRVTLIKTLMPDACIGVDVITGFPGEEEENFMETVEFLKALPVSYFHVFTYSERENTTALRITPVVPEKTRQERTQILRMLSEKKKRAFYESQAGKTRTALFESEEDEGFMYGFTENYVKVKTAFDPALVNALVAVALKHVHADGHMLVDLKENITA